MLESGWLLLYVGLIFDESAGADSTLEPEQVKPKVALIEDPKQSQVRMCKCSVGRVSLQDLAGWSSVAMDSPEKAGPVVLLSTLGRLVQWCHGQPWMSVKSCCLLILALYLKP